MTLLYPNQCYKELFYIGTAPFISLFHVTFRFCHSILSPKADLHTNAHFLVIPI